jgi:SOS-response transcriptional repressor LexA
MKIPRVAAHRFVRSPCVWAWPRPPSMAIQAMKAKGAVTWQPRKPCTLEILIDLDTLPLSSASLADTSTSDRRRLGGRPSPGSTPATADVHTAAGPADGEEDQPEHSEARNGGPIAAGEGVVIDADLEQIITVPGVPRKAGELIAFHVQGQSMTGAGIFPGDLVVVRWTRMSKTANWLPLNSKARSPTSTCSPSNACTCGTGMSVSCRRTPTTSQSTLPSGSSAGSSPCSTRTGRRNYS